MDEYAVAQGYTDEADLLSQTGYATSLAYAQAHGFGSVAALLSGSGMDSVESYLNANGVFFEQP